MREKEIEREKAEYRGVMDSLVKVKGEKCKMEEEVEKEREMKKNVMAVVCRRNNRKGWSFVHV